MKVRSRAHKCERIPRNSMKAVTQPTNYGVAWLFIGFVTVLIVRIRYLKTMDIHTPMSEFRDLFRIICHKS